MKIIICCAVSDIQQIGKAKVFHTDRLKTLTLSLLLEVGSILCIYKYCGYIFLQLQ